MAGGAGMISKISTWLVTVFPAVLTPPPARSGWRFDAVLFAHQVSAAAVAADHQSPRYSRSMALRMVIRDTANSSANFFHREEGYLA